MVVLDSFAVLALLKGELAAPEVQRLVGEARLTSTGLAEVIDHLVRSLGTDAEEAVLDLAELGLLDAIPLDAPAGLRSGLLRAEHYHRSRRAVSLIDCTVADAALRHDGSVATADPHLLDLCRDAGIAVMPLPDSTGARWREG